MTKELREQYQQILKSMRDENNSLVDVVVNELKDLRKAFPERRDDELLMAMLLRHGVH